MKAEIQRRPLSANNISVVPKNWFDGKDSSQFDLDGVNIDGWGDKGSLGKDVVNTNNDTTRPLKRAFLWFVFLPKPLPATLCRIVFTFC